MKLAYPEFVENPESRCPVVLVLDVSKSMEGAPLEALNDALATFKFDVEQDETAAIRVEVAIITFGGDVKLIQDFVTMDHFTAPILEHYYNTPMGSALEMALDKVEERKETYKENGIPYYRPWVFLITDGTPTDGEKWKEVSVKVHEAEANNRLSFFAVGVGDADMKILAEIAPKNRPPMLLNDLHFKELFLWLSASMRRVSTGKVGDVLCLPPVDGWAKIAS